jgi:hypothetical protein
MPELSRPHYTKLTACLKNPRLPEADKERLEEATRKYLDSSKYHHDVFQRMIDKIQTLIDDTSPSMENVLNQGHF